MLGMERAAAIDLTIARARARVVAAAINLEGTPRPTFARSSQNMAVALLDTLSAPSTNGVDKVYYQLRAILGIATKQKVESSLQDRAKVSVSSPGSPKSNQQRTATGTVSSPVQAPSCLRPGHLFGRPEPPARCQARERDEGAHSEHRARIPRHGGHSDRER
jgi:hypothetical protein